MSKVRAYIVTFVLLLSTALVFQNCSKTPPGSSSAGSNLSEGTPLVLGGDDLRLVSYSKDLSVAVGDCVYVSVNVSSPSKEPLEYLWIVDNSSVKTTSGSHKVCALESSYVAGTTMTVKATVSGMIEEKKETLEIPEIRIAVKPKVSGEVFDNFLLGDYLPNYKTAFGFNLRTKKDGKKPASYEALTNALVAAEGTTNKAVEVITTPKTMNLFDPEGREVPFTAATTFRIRPRPVSPSPSRLYDLIVHVRPMSFPQSGEYSLFVLMKSTVTASYELVVKAGNGNICRPNKIEPVLKTAAGELTAINLNFSMDESFRGGPELKIKFRSSGFSTGQYVDLYAIQVRTAPLAAKGQAQTQPCQLASENNWIY